MVKLLISGAAGTGKTSLTKNLKDAFVLSHDGKKYPFKIPHYNLKEFDTADELIEIVSEKLEKYKEKFGDYPKTVVFDSVSKIFDSMLDYCNKKYNGFTIYTQLDINIRKFTEFIENDLVGGGFNVVLISHTIYNPDTAKHELVAKGSFAKRGGFYAEVDHALFVEHKGSKRTIYFRSNGNFPARTTLEDDPDKIDVKDFNLQNYIEKLEKEYCSADEYEL